MGQTLGRFLNFWKQQQQQQQQQQQNKNHFPF